MCVFCVRYRRSPVIALVGSSAASDWYKRQVFQGAQDLVALGSGTETAAEVVFVWDRAPRSPFLQILQLTISCAPKVEVAAQVRVLALQLP